MNRPAAIAICIALLPAAVSAARPGSDPRIGGGEPGDDPPRHHDPGGPQNSDTAGLSAWLRFDEPGPFEALLTWYPPLFIRNGIDLKDFIRSGEFAAFRRAAGDTRAVDAIYVRAMSLTANNTAAALMLATVATLDHYTVGVRVPLLNLFLPLTNESYEDFTARVGNLPADFYPDSPAGRGDRDKLQHFFGSAFVAMAFESRDAAQRVGDFIEVGEAAAIVDGVLDSRDERANWNGREFGIALLDDNRRYPSEFFRTPIVGGGPSEGGPEGGVATGRPGAATYNGESDRSMGCR